MSNKLELIRFEAKSFMGIDQSSPVILDFTKFRKEKNITIFKGDQATRKTSTMNALLFSLGHTFEFTKENLINLKDDTISTEFEFEFEGAKYRVRSTKQKFTLDKWVESEKVWIGAGSPKETLKKMLGNVATSPMHLKDLRGRDQIKWFREFFSIDHSGPGRMSKEEKLMAELDEATKARRDANREYDRIKKALDSNDLFVNREKLHEKFATPVTIESVKKRLDQATFDFQAYNQKTLQQGNIKNRIVSTEERIIELEAQLADARKTLIAYKQEEDKLVQYFKESENVKIAYDQAQTEFQQASMKVVEYNNWKDMLKLESEMHQFESLVQRADAKKDELRNELLEITKKFLPKIKGLKLKIAESLEDKTEGIFLNDKSLSQISESELWNFFLQVCVHNEVSFVFLENLSSLGTGAVDRINELAAKGVKIFCTLMQRDKTEMQISFTDKID